MSELAIAHLTGVDKVLGGLIRAVGPCGLVVDGHCAPFQTLAEAITHQQLNGTAAKTILRRFVACCSDTAFPTPQDVLATPEKTLRAAGLSFAKIAAVKDLAVKTIEGVVPDHDTLVALGDLEIVERLTRVRGIGRWTVEMMLMFRLGRPDVLPVDDFGVRNGFRLTYGLRAMPEPRVLALFGERWGPHRSAAAWYLWRAVELARAGKLPTPAERIKLPRIRKRRRVAKTARKGRGGTRVAKPRTPKPRGKAKRSKRARK